jgi:hypothetical protein
LPLEIEGAQRETLLTSRAGGYLRCARWCLRCACWHLFRRPDGGRFQARFRDQSHGHSFGPWRWGHGFPPVVDGPPPITFLRLVRRRVHQCRQRGKPLLLTQPILLVVLFQMLPPPDPFLLRARRPLLLPLLRCMADGPGPMCRRVRPRSAHDNQLWAEAVRSRQQHGARNRKKKKDHAHQLAIVEHHE